LNDPVAETLQLIVRNSFAILRTLVTARYLHAKVQGLQNYIRAAHEEISDMELEQAPL
jgi:hypothetical protein